MPCSRMRMAVCVSWSILPARCGNSKKLLRQHQRVVLLGQELRGPARRAAPQRSSRRRCAPWPSHDARVGGHAQKLIEDRPSGVPSIRSCRLALEPVSAGRMQSRVCIGGVYQHIWCRPRALAPSMAWYRAARSATSTSAPPLRNFGNAGILPPLSSLRGEQYAQRGLD
jgi:hypothetical protein